MRTCVKCITFSHVKIKIIVQKEINCKNSEITTRLQVTAKRKKNKFFCHKINNEKNAYNAMPGYQMVTRLCDVSSMHIRHWAMLHSEEMFVPHLRVAKYLFRIGFVTVDVHANGSTGAARSAKSVHNSWSIGVSDHNTLEINRYNNAVRTACAPDVMILCTFSIAPQYNSVQK